MSLTSAPPHRRISHSGTCALALLATMALGARPALAINPTNAEVIELNAMSMDSTRAGDAVKRLRAALAARPDSNVRPFLHQTLLRSLVVGRAPIDQVLAEADSVVKVTGWKGLTLVNLYVQLADQLLVRGERVDRALAYARDALAISPTTADGAYARAICHKYIGLGKLALGDATGAIPDLLEAVAMAPDSNVVLFNLGRAYEKSGKLGEAEDAYLRSLAVFPIRDSLAASPLRALVAKRHGDLAALDGKIAAGRRDARERVALADHRHFGVAPEWSLPDLAGRVVDSKEFKGRVTVVDFWGSWCGPCRAELPHFQTVYERFKDRGVVFVGINWEREQDPEVAKKTTREFVESNHYSFPVVLDQGRQAVESYAIDSFPTVFLIDKEGHFRYRNVGFSGDIAEILGAQIESLLE